MSGSIPSVGSVASVEQTVRQRDSATVQTDASSDNQEPERPPYSLKPALTIDADVGLAILQFYDQNGQVLYSVPNARQIDAYRVAMNSEAPQTDQAGPSGGATGQTAKV
ncbi:hypothetical protein [Telmatospirillum sp.]|uniref:hypothetical protein n=1 Tax=Telmatospirillum sp. TaxID=2079197 RepID=UPI002846E909|nr:hypothetical protein [Telmatospirillum sp.]MDR3440139.1 hypothetical protein [Telmatospirillum sp.]